jgi:hypothetical protein
VLLAAMTADGTEDCTVTSALSLTPLLAKALM